MNRIKNPNLDLEKLENLKQEMSDFPLSDEILSILLNREIDTPSNIKSFLNPKLFDLTNPFTINDMEKAVRRIKQAILNEENILIYGDKDVDGQTSIALLKNILEDYGINPDYYVPVEEGYGLHKSILANLLEKNISLLITVDCGITNVEEVKYLQEQGIDIIITDHHEPLERIPECIAVVDPKISGGKVKNLAGCGVVFYLGWALQMSFWQNFDKTFLITDSKNITIKIKNGNKVVANDAGEFMISSIDICKAAELLYPKIPNRFEDLAKFFRLDIENSEETDLLADIYWKLFLKNDIAIADYFKKYISFVALGTISDIMPLLDDNRFLVRYGLHNMKNTKIKGMKRWLEDLIGNVDKLDATFIAWNVTPILNSAGRMEKPDLGVEFLCAKTEDKAMEILDAIQTLNNARKKLQTKDVKTVERIIEDNELSKDANLIFVAHENLDKNITGIIANNIMKKHFKPTFILSKGETEAVGSVRAPKGYDIVSLLDGCNEYLERFGGHKLAGGFTLKNENISNFRDKLLEICTCNNVESENFYQIDLEIEADKITDHFLKEIFMLEPFGHQNCSPNLLIKNCKFLSLNYLGMNKEHIKGILKIANSDVEVIGWGIADLMGCLKNNENVNIVANVEKNFYNGISTIRIKILDCISV